MHKVSKGFGHTVVPPFLQSDGMWQLSDRAQWIQWALQHPDEAAAHMKVLHGRVFDSMYPEYREGDFIFHSGGGGAFGHMDVDKYTEVLQKCRMACCV